MSRGHIVELCLLSSNSTKQCSSFEGKTYLFADTAIEFNSVRAWKRTEVGNNPSFEASIYVSRSHNKICSDGSILIWL